MTPSTSEPLGHFQPNLEQSNIGGSGFKFVQMKSHVNFEWEIIAKKLKFINNI